MSVEVITIPLGFDQSYVLIADGVIAVDAGQPNKGADFVRALEAAEINPHDLKLVVLTHGHWDHIGSAREIKSLTGADLAIHRAEARRLEDSPTPLSPGVTAWGKIFEAVHQLFMPLIKVPAAKADLVIDDDGLSLAEYGIPGQVVHTPGHSPGSVSVLLDSGEAFVGDLAMNKFPLTLSPSLPIFADDPAAVVSSWKKLMGLGAKTVFPAHGKPFPIAVIEKAISRRA